MSYTPEELAAMTGEKQYKQAPVGGQYFDTITLGKDGKFYASYYSQPKDERADPDELGDKFEGTILLIRRKMVAWADREKVFESVEYDAGAELVSTTAGDISEKEAKSLHLAKVGLVLYLLRGEDINKLTVTGGSLYNPDDEDDMRLYPYLQSFDEDEHTFMYQTIIGAKENSYTDNQGFEIKGYQMTFKRGASHKDLSGVGDAIVKLKELLPECDARDLRFLGKSGGSSKPNTTVEYPSEEINPNDVPF